MKQVCDFAEVLRELSQKHGIKLIEQGEEADFYYCPFCQTHQIDINTQKGVYICHRCNDTGHISKLYDSLEGEHAFLKRFGSEQERSAPQDLDLKRLANVLSKNLLKEKNASIHARAVLEGQKGIEVDTMFYHKIGYADENFYIPQLKSKHYHLKNCIVFPVFDREKNIVNLRFKQMRNLTPDPYYKKHIFNLTGYGSLTTNYIYIPEIESPEKSKTERIWIFEGETDALIAWQCLQYHAVPEFFYSTKIITGTGGAGSIPKEWTEEFFSVPTTVFYDSDQAGAEGARKLQERSRKIRMADLRYLLHDDEDNDINDLLNYLGMYRGYKALRFLEILAINENRDADVIEELNALKTQMNQLFSVLLKP